MFKIYNHYKGQSAKTIYIQNNRCTCQDVSQYEYIYNNLLTKAVANSSVCMCASVCKLMSVSASVCMPTCLCSRALSKIFLMAKCVTDQLTNSQLTNSCHHHQYIAYCQFKKMNTEWAFSFHSCLKCQIKPCQIEK